jgi:hypothetical protein
LARQTGAQPPVPDSPPPSPVEQALIEYRCRVARKEMSEECLTAQLLALRTDFGRDLNRLSAAERRTTDSVCNKTLAARGREAYVQCLSDQLVALRERRIRANPPPPPPPEATPSVPPATDPSAGAQQPPPAPQPSRSYGLWIGAALAVLGIAAGGAFVAMRTRQATRKCRVCGASVSDSGDLCQQCRHDAAQTLRRAATERADRQRAQEEARRRQSQQAEEDRLQKARQEEAARLRVQEQARQPEEARRAEEVRQRDEEARQRSQVGGGASGEFDPYATLGVAPDATREAIETAYQAAKAKYDAENAAFLPSELQELFKAKGLAAERAYKMLTE